jgi:hypothetical protein
MLTSSAHADTYVENGMFVLIADDIDLVTETQIEAEDRARGHGIAQYEGVLAIQSPSTDARLSLTVEVWSEAPADDRDEWMEVFEASIDVTNSGGLKYHSIGGPASEFDVADGRYVVEICARGFADNDPSVEADTWRVRLWPSTLLRPAVWVKRFDGPDRHEQQMIDRITRSAIIPWKPIYKPLLDLRRDPPRLNDREEERLEADDVQSASDDILMMVTDLVVGDRTPDPALADVLDQHSAEIEDGLWSLSRKSRRSFAVTAALGRTTARIVRGLD